MLAKPWLWCVAHQKEFPAGSTTPMGSSQQVPLHPWEFPEGSTTPMGVPSRFHYNHGSSQQVPLQPWEFPAGSTTTMGVPSRFHYNHGSSQQVPLHPWEFPGDSWKRLHIDFARPFLNNSCWFVYKVVGSISHVTNHLSSYHYKAEETVCLL